MDDASKIKILMIYYDHWGKEELQARKTAHGVRETLSLLRGRFETKDHTLKDGLLRMFRYLEYEDMVFLWSDFADIFLQREGCFDPLSSDEPYEEDEILFDRKVLLETHLNLHNEDTSDLIYDDEFGYEDVLSVDAIVALL